MEKISQDDNKKLVTSLSIIEQIHNKTLVNNIIMERKNILVSTIRHSIPDLGVWISYMKNTEKELTQIFEDELYDDLYDNVEWEKVKNYIRYSQNSFLKQEFIIQELLNFISEIIDIINNISMTDRTPQFNLKSQLEETSLSPEEVESLVRTSKAKIIDYKNASRSNQKVWISYFLKLADTEEKFKIIDDLFFEMTGEKVLANALKKKKVVKDSAR